MRKRSEKRSAHATAQHKTARQRLPRRQRFGSTGVRIFSRSSPDQGISLHQQKSPTRQLGACGIALSREERGLLRHGRVAWLTAFQPITVAGPRPIRTAFPASLACKLKFECMPQPLECQCTAENDTTENGANEKAPRVFTGSSSWACAFLPVRAGLPANPRDGKAHSRKCSLTA